MRQRISNSSLPFSLLPGICIFLFFLKGYPYHLHYQEQNQLFLLTTDYLTAIISHPGGFSQYLAGFITQFYIHPWLGALLIAALLVSLQQAALIFMRTINVPKLFYSFSILPIFLYWALLCNENYMLSALIAQLLVLIVGIVYAQQKSPFVRICSMPILLILLFILAGGIYHTLFLFMLLTEILYFRQLSRGQWIIFLTVNILVIIGLPLFTKYICLAPYPFRQLWEGIGYYRYPAIFPVWLPAIWGITVCLPFILRFLPQSSAKKGKRLQIVFPAAIFLLGGLLIYSQYKPETEERMHYDYLLRHKQWNNILEIARTKTPDTPLSTMAVNLSLQQTGQLANRMFYFPQNGPEGLLPFLDNNYNTAFAYGEVYYHLGMINTAQRIAFEGMESIPDYQKSARAIKRLAETNLINGHYAVAGKYLRMLQKTFFYRLWANRTMELLTHEDKLNKHPEYGRLRAMRPQDDRLFSEYNKPNMLASQFAKQPANRPVGEYLIALALLNKDLGSFMSMLPSAEKWHQFMPVHYQEALLLAWAEANTKDPIPPVIDPMVVRRFNEFRKNREGHSNTYWDCYFGKSN